MKILNETDIRNAYMYAVEILEKVGVIFDTEQSRQLFRENGARVEDDKVYISAALLEKSLRIMPDSEYDDSAPKVITATSPFGNVPIIYDEKLGAHRRATIADTIKMYQLTQTSDIYECANPAIVDPVDLEGDDTYVSQIAMLMRYTDKWISNGLRATAQNSRDRNLYESTKNAILLIKKFHDKWDEPIMSQGFCPLSPLKYDRECLDCLTAVVEEKQSVALYPCSLTNMTGPASLFEQVIHDFAISLAGIVYIQLLSPGTEVSLSPSSGTTDMRSLQPAYGNPETVYLSAAFYEICRYYKISCSMCGTLADSAQADYQAGIESCLTTLLPYMASDIDTVWCYPGHLSAWRCGSFRKAIFDEEVIKILNRVFQGMDSTVEPNYLSTLLKAQQDKSFLTGRTPKAYRRDHYLPVMFSKYGVTQDTSADKTDINVMADNEIRKRIESYVAPEITTEQKKILQPYLPAECKFDF